MTIATFAGKLFLLFPFDSLLHIAGLIAALIIGVTLGIFGSGGAAITVPVLVYLIGYAPSQSIDASLFIVGITSLTGGLINLKRGLVKWQPLIWFGIPSVIMVFVTRRIIYPLIPDIIFQNNSFTLNKESFLLVFFAVMLVIVAYRMISTSKLKNTGEKNLAIFMSVIVGLGVGALTGLLGIGGGFIIVPVLVFYFGLDAKQAVGTSLWLIAMNSLFGYFSRISHEASDWSFLFIYVVLSISGMFAGIRLSKTIPSEKIKHAFGYFILLLGVFIIIQEILFPLKK